MLACDVDHADPRPLARAAAVRAARELDPLTRAHAGGMGPSERLRAGFELSQTASRLRAAFAAPRR